MQHNNTIMGIRLLAPLALAAAGAGQAMAAGDMAAQRGAQMAFMSGSTYGAVEACGGAATEKLDEMAQGQKRVFLQMGYSEAEFDAKFKEGYEAGKTSVASSPPDERAESCEGLRSTGMIGG